jgi:integrase
MAPRKRLTKNKDLPPNLGYDNKGGKIYYYYRRPDTKVKTYWANATRRKAIAAANVLNAKFEKADNLIGAVMTNTITKNDSAYTFNNVLSRFQSEFIPSQNLKPKTLRVKESRIKRLQKDIGSENIESYSLKNLAEYLDETFVNDTYLRMRSLLGEVYNFAKRKGLYTGQDNPAHVTEKKSGNGKQRTRMTKEGFKAIYDEAPDWLKDAMDFALITLQARNEVVNAKFDDEQDEHFHIIRLKTKDQTDRAYIRFPVNDNLRELISRCRARPVLSPFLIAHKPQKRVRENFNNREHWSQVLPDYLTKQFQKVRDNCGFFEGVEMSHRPTFHEIRALGGDLYREAGYSKEYINLLYGHTTLGMTEEYLKGHRITWSNCEAGLDIKKALEAK